MVAFIQDNQMNGGSSPQSVAFVSNVGAGHLIVVTIFVGGALVALTVTGTQGETFALAKSQHQDLDGHGGYVYWGVTATAGTDTITVSGFGSSTFRCIIREYDATYTVLDQVASAQANGSTALDSGATPTTTAANELLVAAGTNDQAATFTAGLNYGNLQASPPTAGSQRTASCDREVTSTGAYDGLLTSSIAVNWTCIVATFKGAATAAALPPRSTTVLQAVNRASTY